MKKVPQNLKKCPYPLWSSLLGAGVASLVLPRGGKGRGGAIAVFLAWTRHGCRWCSGTAKGDWCSHPVCNNLPPAWSGQGSTAQKYSLHGVLEATV